MKILIAAGGSGGHIFPATALARTLRAGPEAVEVLFVGGGKGLDRRIFEKEGFPFRLLSDNKLSYRRKSALPGFTVKLFFDLVRALHIIWTYTPDVVVGFGGYVAFPMVLAARTRRIPCVIHEQNVMPGRANRALARFADRVAVTFNETARGGFGDGTRVVVTGNPIRREVFTGDRSGGLRKFGLEDGKRTVLVVGGSQGAHRLNEVFLEALAAMTADERAGLQAIHLTGRADYEWVRGRYDGLAVGHSVHSFIDRIEEAYSAADVIVTRAGASVICEAAFCRRPMILVPYPYAMNHQRENARVFADTGAAILLEEKDLTAGRFRDAIATLLADDGRRRAMAEAASRLIAPDASERLAAVVCGAARKRVC